jgi:hypothetical protein
VTPTPTTTADRLVVLGDFREARRRRLDEALRAEEWSEAHAEAVLEDSRRYRAAITRRRRRRNAAAGNLTGLPS